MSARRLHVRLDRLMPSAAPLWPLVTIFPDAWPAEATAAYDAAVAKDDTDRQATLIHQQTGETVELTDGAQVQLIEIRTAEYGPV